MQYLTGTVGDAGNPLTAEACCNMKYTFQVDPLLEALGWSCEQCFSTSMLERPGRIRIGIWHIRGVWGNPGKVFSPYSGRETFL